MPSDRSSRAPHVALASEGREQANVLLHELLNDRRRCEERRTASGKEDLLKTLTGRSSLDRAIASTREIIVRMDNLLAELGGVTPSVDGDGSTTTRTNGVRAGASTAPASGVKNGVENGVENGAPAVVSNGITVATGDASASGVPSGVRL